jgi:hypothetical protein
LAPITDQGDSVIVRDSPDTPCSSNASTATT